MPARTAAGGGLRLAASVGAASPRDNDGFYGHLIAWKVSLDDSARWDNLTLLHSRASLLVDEAGLRFTDETRGDNISALATAATGGRGLLIWDESIHREFVLQSWPPGNAGIDKFDIALRNGGVGMQCADVAELCAFATTHGFDGFRLAETLEVFNEPAVGREPTAAPRQGVRRSITEPPFFVLIVEPAVTFPFAGIQVDPAARVITSANAPLGGLLAAGVDVGDVSREGYGGGLALAAGFAVRAMRTAGLA